MTLDALLISSARDRPEDVFLIDGDRAITFAGLLAEARDVAASLRIAPGEPVAIVLPAGASSVASFFGVLLAGGVAVPIDPRLRPPEIAFLVQHCRCRTVLGAEVASVSEPRPLPGAAVVLATSGSTASPKAVILSHRAILADARAFAAVYDLGPGDTLLATLSLCHSFGLTAWLSAGLHAGARLVIPADAQPARLAALAAKHRPTVFLAASSFYQYLVRGSVAAGDLSSVRAFIGGACTLPGAVAEAFRAKLGRDVIATYGLTEAAPVVTANPIDDNRAGTVGPPLPGVDVRIDDGEILVRGEIVMDGYLDNPAATAAAIGPDGWLRTGDLGRLDGDGYLTILGRRKDLIIRGGEKIFPEEIEEVLHRHPAVAEAAVIGMADPVYEEIPVAFVVLAAPGAIDEAALAAHCREALAAFKVPRTFRRVEALPRSANGKLDKRALRARLVDPLRSRW